MRYVNVLFALKEINYQRLKDNFRVDVNGDRLRTDFTVPQLRKLRNHYDGTWPPVQLAETYRVMMFTFPEITNVEGDISSGHKWVDFLTDHPDFPNAWILIGVWNIDGSQWGTRIVSTENGVDVVPKYDRVVTLVDKEVFDLEATIANQAHTTKTIQVEEVSFVENGTQEVPHFDITVEGTPVYPLHPQYMKIMPDDVTYDQDGNETSRTPAAAPKDVCLIAGQKPRRWAA